MKVIVNRCYGGYSFSHEAIVEYAKRSNMPLYYRLNDYGEYDYFKSQAMTEDSYWSHYSLRDCRTDSILIDVLQELGDKANGRFAELAIVDIPDDVKWHIEEYDGSEWVAEDHRTW